MNLLNYLNVSDCENKLNIIQFQIYINISVFNSYWYYLDTEYKLLSFNWHLASGNKTTYYETMEF